MVSKGKIAHLPAHHIVQLAAPIRPPSITSCVGVKIARLQSGYLYSYALVMLLGLIGAASWAIWWAGK